MKNCCIISGGNFPKEIMESLDQIAQESAKRFEDVIKGKEKKVKEYSLKSNKKWIELFDIMNLDEKNIQEVKKLVSQMKEKGNKSYRAFWDQVRKDIKLPRKPKKGQPENELRYNDKTKKIEVIIFKK